MTRRVDQKFGITLVFNEGPRPYVGEICKGGLAEKVHVKFEDGEPRNNRLQVKDEVLRVNDVRDPDGIARLLRSEYQIKIYLYRSAQRFGRGGYLGALGWEVW